MKTITLSLIICLFCISTNAQEKKNFVQKLIDKGFMAVTEFKVGGQFLNLKGKDFEATDFIPSLGYNFNRYLNTRIIFGGETALFEKDGVRDWAKNEVMGLGVGIVPVRFEDEGTHGLIELFLAAGSTVQHKYEWQYTCYDAGINIAMGKQTVKLQVGFGLRYYDARRMDNRMTGYISIGCRVN